MSVDLLPVHSLLMIFLHAQEVRKSHIEYAEKSIYRSSRPGQQDFEITIQDSSIGFAEARPTSAGWFELVVESDWCANGQETQKQNNHWCLPVHARVMWSGVHRHSGFLQVEWRSGIRSVLESSRLDLNDDM